MQRRLASIVLGLILTPMAAILAVPGAAAAAPVDCNQTVVDQDNLFGSRTGDVEAAANKLSSATGADVRVRTYASIAPDTAMDKHFEPARVAECDSWQNANGKRKDNLIEYLVYFLPQNKPDDNRMGMYYGADWTPMLGKSDDKKSVANRIKGTIIKPAFQSRKFADGIINAMAETGNVITAYQHPAAQTQTGNRPAAPTKVDNRTFNFGPIAWVLGGIALLIALLVLYFFVIRPALGRRRRAGEERASEQQRAIGAKTAAVNLINQLNSTRREVLKARAAKYGIQGDPDGDAITAAYALVLQHYEAATGALNQIQASSLMGGSDSVSGGPEDDTLPTGVYTEMANSYEQVRTDAQAAVSAAAQVDDLARTVESRVQSLPQVTEDETSAVQRARALVAQLRAGGFTGEVIEQIEITLGEAEENLAAVPGLGATMQAVRLLAAATAARKLAEQTATQIRKDYDDVGGRAADLEARIDEAIRLGAEAIKAFGRIKSGNPERAWETIRGNGTEADKRVRLANAALAEARTHGDTAHQEWDAARALIEQAMAPIGEAIKLLQAIMALEAAINRARDMAAEEIRLADVDLKKAQVYERKNDDEVNDVHKAELRDAEQKLDDARAEAAASQPDWVRVVTLAQQANSLADNILAAAMGEVESAARVRRQLATTIETAAAAIETAKRYIANHKGDVRKEARELLDDAQTALKDARGTADPANALSYAQTAKQNADGALRKAKRNFSDAENDRKEQRRAARRAAERRSGSTSGYGGGYGSSNSNSGDLLTGILIGEAASGWGDSGGDSVTVNNNTYDGGGFIADSSPAPDYGGGSDMGFGGGGDGGGGSDMGGF